MGPIDPPSVPESED